MTPTPKTEEGRYTNILDALQGAGGASREVDEVWVKLEDARRAVDSCGGTYPAGEDYGRGYDEALTEADAALVRLGRTTKDANNDR